MEVGPPKPAATATEASSSSCSSVAATAASLVAVGLGGAALLVWWALSFHPAHARLWMVPAGLVLLGTPVLAWLSLLASGPCRCGRRPVEAPAPGAHAGLSGTPLRSLQPATRSSSSSIDTYMPV